jgi:hypothetical protein
MSWSRFIVGVILVLAAALMFLTGQGNFAPAGAIALAVLGVVSIAISRRGNNASAI